MAKMTGAMADDLASAVLLATDRPVLIAPAMNPHMWNHPATRRNLAQLAADGIAQVGPNEGEMARRASGAGPDGGAARKSRRRSNRSSKWPTTGRSRGGGWW